MDDLTLDEALEDLSVRRGVSRIFRHRIRRAHGAGEPPAHPAALPQLHRHRRASCPRTKRPPRGVCRLLQQAYQDFVKSDALTEKVFKVFHMHEPQTTFVPLTEITLNKTGQRRLPRLRAAAGAAAAAAARAAARWVGAMEQRFDFGEAVRLTRNVRNDGTFPGLDIGNLLIKRGSVGYVMNVGTFLQDQVIYTVNFLDQGRVVGCREEELHRRRRTWVESRFETREKVRGPLHAVGARRSARRAGTEGEVFKVLRDLADGVQYHVLFPGQAAGAGVLLEQPVLTRRKPRRC